MTQPRFGGQGSAGHCSAPFGWPGPEAEHVPPPRAQPPGVLLHGEPGSLRAHRRS